MPESKQIFLSSIIDDWEADSLQWQVNQSAEKKIDLFIASVGGSVNAGLRMAAFIQGINAKADKEIHTYNLSNADSIATAVFLAPDPEKRHILEHSTMFIHEPRLMLDFDITQEKSEKTAETLKMQKDRIADFYVKNIKGLSKDEALSLMAGEIDMNASMMLEKGIVAEVMPNFEIAAIRKEMKNIINQNLNEMSLFGKKDQPINTVALNDGTTVLAFEGELKEGIEVQKIGEVANLKGEHITNDNQKLVVDDKNVITSLEVIEAKKGEGNFDADAFRNEIAEQTAIAITDALKPVNDALSALKGTHKPEKGSGVNNQVNNSKRPQAEARKSVNDYMKENVDVQKNRN